jgi:hypothetical protein
MKRMDLEEFYHLCNGEELSAISKLMTRERRRLAETFMPTDCAIGEKKEYNHFLKIYSTPHDLFIRVRAEYWYHDDLTFDTEIVDVYQFPDEELYDLYRSIYFNSNPN